ncbi:MAG: siderophore-interacting protein [Dietzia sp.]
MTGANPPEANPTEDRPWEYSAFPVEVREKEKLSPHFLRLTFAGESLRHFAAWGVDQRIKVVLPLADGSITDVGLLDDPTPHPSQWYTRWRSLPEDERNVLRTYTPSAIRPDEGEIDVDFYLHEPAGPASAWARSTTVGDRLVITGPDSRAGWTGYGINWDPGSARRLLLVADETAFPAVRNILRRVPPDARVDVFLECGDPADDTVSAHAPENAEVHVVRRVSESRTDLEHALRTWIGGQGADLRGAAELYVWLAGESGTTTRIRRELTDGFGIAKDRVAFLGYWKTGGPIVG